MDPNPAGPVQLVTREDRKRANDQRRNQKRKQKKHEDPDASEVRRFGGMLSPTKRKQPPKSDQPPKKKRPTKSEPNTAACEPLASTSSNEPVMETLTHLDTPTQFIDEFQLYEHLYMSSGQALKDFINKVQDNFPADAEEDELEESEAQTWGERQSFTDDEWAAIDVMNSYLKFSAFFKFCQSCRKVPQLDLLVRCLSCNKLFCHACDLLLHGCERFHNRWLTTKSFTLPMSEMLFLNGSGTTYNRDVPVPCMVPEDCPNCGTCDCLTLVPGTHNIKVVTEEGRYDMKSAGFYCESCQVTTPADVGHYIASGFWPGTPRRITYLFRATVLRLFYFLRHNSPSLSMRKFLESLENVAVSSRGVTLPINRNQFERASRQYDYFNHQIDESVKLVDKTSCKACGDDPLAAHIDGNMKLGRWIHAQGVDSKNLFGNRLIATDEEFQNHVKVLEEVLPSKSKESESCLTATLKAARTDSSKTGKLDETGLDVCCCRHLMIQGAVSMNKGETFKHTNFLHCLLAKKKYKFVCLDVMCRYWKYAQKVMEELGDKFPELKDTKPFLSRMHANLHAWYCRFLWSGHMKAGAALTTGEEQEIVNAHISRYNVVTKHMGKHVRIEHLTSGFLKWNVDVNKKLPIFLMSKRDQAFTIFQQAKSRLKDFFKTYQIGFEDLQSMFEEIEKFAIQCREEERMQVKEGSIQLVERKLHSYYIQLQTTKRNTKTVAETSKERTTQRQNQSAIQRKVKDLIASLQVSKPKWNFTKQDFDNGYFPWLFPQISSKKETQDILGFKLVKTGAIADVQVVLERLSSLIRVMKDKLDRVPNMDSVSNSHDGMGTNSDDDRSDYFREKREKYEMDIQSIRIKEAELITFYNRTVTEEEQISELDVANGSLPWKKPTIPYNDKLKIVDSWMLWQRAQEEKVQSENEIKQYLSCVSRDISKLKEQREHWLSQASNPSDEMNAQDLRSAQKICQQKATLVFQAIENLESQQRTALKCFRRDPTLVSISSPFLEFETILEMDYSDCSDAESDSDSESEASEVESEAEWWMYNANRMHD